MNLQPTAADREAAEEFGRLPLLLLTGSSRCGKPCRTTAYLEGVLAERARAAGVAVEVSKESGGNACIIDKHGNLTTLGMAIAWAIRSGPLSAPRPVRGAGGVDGNT